MTVLCSGAMVRAPVALGAVVVTVVDVWADADTAARSPSAAVVAIRVCLMTFSS
jgi:hypothetical protein